MFENSLTQVLGIELILLGENTYRCHACLLHKKGGMIAIHKEVTCEGTLVQILEKIPRGYPTSLSLSGKGILFKSLKASDGIGNLELCNTAFPAVKPSDFYLQILNLKQQAILHIVRRTLADPIIETYSKAGISIYSLSLGASVTSVLWDLLELNEDLLKVQRHSFHFSAERELISYEYNSLTDAQDPIRFSGQEIKNNMLIAYSSALQLILHNKLDLVSAEAEDIQFKFQSYLESLSLKRKAVILVGALFISLLLSFLIFSHYNQENSRLAGKADLLASSESIVEQYKNDIIKDEALLRTLNWNGGYQPGFLLKEIGQGCPRQLALTKISINAQSGKSFPAQAAIQLEGQSSNLNAVNNWIFLLKEKTWVKAVKLQGYAEDTESGYYKFNIRVNY